MCTFIVNITYVYVDTYYMQYVYTYDKKTELCFSRIKNIIIH